MPRIIKLIFYIILGAIGGALCTILLFVHEGSTIRSIPTWAMVLSIITAIIGAVITGSVYHDILYENENDDIE